jgi:hypothetical protein
MKEKKSPNLFNVGVMVLFILMFVCPSIGQSDGNSIHLGVKAGVSIPNLVGGGGEEITKDYKSRVATNFGGFVDFGLSRKVSLVVGVDYAGQGGRRNGIQPITSPIPGLPPLPPGSYYFADFKNTAKLHYLEVPVLLKYTWERNEKPSVYVDGGGYFGYLLSAKTITRGSSTIYLDSAGTPLLIPPFNQPLPPISFDADTVVTDSLHRFNYGIAGGGGIEFPTGKNYVFVDARATYGFATLQRNTVTDGTSHTGALVISVGYAFKLKGK